jgi:hypothetical protein
MILVARRPRHESLPWCVRSGERCELLLDAFGVESCAESLECGSGGEQREAASVGSPRRELSLRVKLACSRRFVWRLGVEPMLVAELEQARGLRGIADH